jgi:hypothetical protein
MGETEIVRRESAQVAVIDVPDSRVPNPNSQNSFSKPNADLEFGHWLIQRPELGVRLAIQQKISHL